MKKIYLAGPITGLSYEAATKWREDVKESLPEYECFSPLRAKWYLQQYAQLPAVSTSDKPLSSAKGILCRDYFDCSTADLIIVNFLNAKRISIGTVAEIAWAWQARKPIIAIMNSKNVHEHDFLNEMIAYKVSTVNDAKSLARAILDP